MREPPQLVERPTPAASASASPFVAAVTLGRESRPSGRYVVSALTRAYRASSSTASVLCTAAG
ncbi:hypothetical protein ACWEOE_07235 [Amycolatopsis sp. NPDC004368]